MGAEAAHGDRLGPRRRSPPSPGWRCSGRSPPPGGSSRATPSGRREAGSGDASAEVLPFSLSIGVLSLVQASLVAAPEPPPCRRLAGLRSRWWALVLPVSIVVVIAAIALDSASAHVADLPGAVRGAAAGGAGAGADRPRRPPAARAAGRAALRRSPGPSRARSTAQAAALALSALACVSLGWLLACVVPADWLKLGIYAMAAIDTWLVASDLLQSPNAVLNAVSPAAASRGCSSSPSAPP